MFEMKKHFWLIQRGSFAKDLNNVKSFLNGRSDALVDPDYMGSAEFEWGAIPRAYRRIFDNFNKYKVIVTPLKTVSDVPFCVFCDEDHYDEILEAIKEYLKEDYQLKEWSNMRYHFSTCRSEDLEYVKYCRQTNFWWCIDKGDIGDWIAFTGATDRQNKFKEIIKADYKQLWEDIPESEKENMRKKIYSW